MGSSVDQFRAAPISPFFGVMAERVKGLAATPYRKWADGDDLINIPLKVPSFFGCKLGMSRKIFIFLLRNCQAQVVVRFSVTW